MSQLIVVAMFACPVGLSASAAPAPASSMSRRRCGAGREAEHCHGSPASAVAVPATLAGESRTMGTDEHARAEWIAVTDNRWAHLFRCHRTPSGGWHADGPETIRSAW